MWISGLVVCLSGLASTALGAVNADFNFMSVRGKVAKDYRGDEAVSAEKYFRECSLSHLHFIETFLTCANP